MLAVEATECNYVGCDLCLFGELGMALVSRDDYCGQRKVGIVACFV